MSVKISKPVIREEKACETGLDVSYAEKLNQAVGTDGLIPVQLEQDVIISRISHDLYANPQSGVRELLANEIRACQETASEHDAKPRIEVSINHQNREFVIHGIDSKGIEQERFLEVLAVLGRSDNFDRSKPGQFGMGFASYTCLSDIVFIETFARNGDKYSVMGKGGMGFQILDKPEMTHYGTKLRMTLNKKVDIDKITKTIEACATLHGIPTTLNVTETSGITRCVVIQQRKLEDFVNTQTTTNSERKHRTHHAVTLENENIAACMRFSKHGHYGTPKIHTFLAGMPIEFTYTGKHGGIVELAINVKREDIFPPTPDRERFTEESSSLIRKELDGLVDAKISEIKVKGISEYIENPETILIDGAGGNIEIDEQTLDISRLVNRSRHTNERDNWIRLNDIKDIQKCLVTKSLTAKKIAAVRNYDSEINVVRADDNTDYENMMYHGLTDLNAYIKNHKIKVDNTKSKKRMRVFYLQPYSYGRYKETCTSDDLPEGTIIVGDAFDVLCGIAAIQRGVNDTYHLAVKAKTASSGITLEQFIHESGRYLYNTNIGIMTAAQIRDCKKPVVITDQTFGSLFGSHKIIVRKNQYAFRLAVVLNNQFQDHILYRDLTPENINQLQLMFPNKNLKDHTDGKTLDMINYTPYIQSDIIKKYIPRLFDLTSYYQESMLEVLMKMDKEIMALKKDHE